MLRRQPLFCLVALLLFCAILPATALAGQSWEENRKEMEKAFSGMLDSVGKGLEHLGNEIQQGVNSMQKKLDGDDGTRIISRREDLERLVKVAVLTVERPSEGVLRITLGVHNEQKEAVRLVDLDKAQNVMLIDAAGFAHDPVLRDDFPRQLNVPHKAARKLRFDFANVDREPERLRLYGQDIPLPATPVVHTL